MKIEAYSDYSKKILEVVCKFKVFSINSKAIYIKNDNNILSLQVRETALSPISLITNLDTFQSLDLDLGDFLIYKDENLYIFSKDREEKKFMIEKKSFYNSNINIYLKDFPAENYLKDVYANSKFLVFSKKTQGINQIFLQDIKANTFIIEFIKNKLEKIENLLKNNEIENGLTRLADSVGLGVGLTPSMDDFLTGFISANFAFSKIDDKIFSSFTKKIRKNIDNTSPISGKFLELGLEGYFNKPIIDFYFFLKNGGSFQKLQEEFSKVGSSSGVDAACGIYFYCKNFLC